MNPTSTHVASGRVFSVVGDRYHFLVTGEESGGAFAMIEFLVPPHHGPPLHSPDADPVEPTPADIQLLLATAPRYGLEIIDPATPRA